MEGLARSRIGRSHSRNLIGLSVPGRFDLNNVRDLSIWEHMLEQIGNSHDSAIAAERMSGQDLNMPYSDALPSRARKIQLVDRPTRTTAILSWSDPTSCHYAYQGWCVSRAESVGVCVLSALPIAKGDEVYKPRASGSRPRNANAMILRRVLEYERTWCSDLSAAVTSLSVATNCGAVLLRAEFKNPLRGC